ncbi:BINDING PROTEIN putative-RELATED [Salix koriyanagi]|uniref:BINDING PROTEIN putative-RELATED n=1 Tax=Salix koriyanagi TaxID=2511006 RepID=A0A9Q0WT28_9ROSI|nr:BINDING PROTEIN putative-RELATED [Salix koriyanagi]
MKVAVKRSDSSHGQGLPEFQTEIMVLSRIQHRHLVSLVGYCDEGLEMILVYEFMEKGTLRDHLYDRKECLKNPSAETEFTWKQRLEICIGSAKGLHYLHTDPDGGIFHRDVKSTNILLDEHYVAKVADFGLSQSGMPDPDHIRMSLKVLCARPPIVNSKQREEINLAEWGMFWQKEGQLEKIIDPLLLQQTPAHEEAYEDNTTATASTDLAFPPMQNLSYNMFPVDDYSDTTVSAVFSQLRINDPR